MPNTSRDFNAAEREILLRRLAVIARRKAKLGYREAVRLTRQETPEPGYPDMGKLDLHEAVLGVKASDELPEEVKLSLRRYRETLKAIGKLKTVIVTGTLGTTKEYLDERNSKMGRHKFNLICDAIEFLARVEHHRGTTGDPDADGKIAAFLGFHRQFDFAHPLVGTVPEDDPADDGKLPPELCGYLKRLLDRTRIITPYPTRFLAGLNAAGMTHDDLHVPLSLYRQVPQKGADGAKENEGAGGVIEKAIDLRDALARWDKFRIVGEPGAGKSTLLREIARAYARAILDDDPTSGSGYGLASASNIPVYVELGEIERIVTTDWIADDLTRLAVHGVDRGDQPLVEAALRSGRAILLLDGYDELTKTVNRTDLLRLVDRHEGAVVLSGRPEALDTRTDHGFRPKEPETSDDPEGATLFLRRLDVKRKREFVRKTYPKVQGREIQIDDLLRHIQQDATAAALSGTPLLLTFMIGIHSAGRKLPDLPSALYMTIAELIVEDWARSRADRRPDALPAPRRKDILFFLPAIAAWMLCEPDGKTSVSGARVEEWVERLLPHHPKRSRREEDSEVWTRRLLEESGFFALKGGRWAFAHHSTFQEFFAGMYLVQRRADCHHLSPSRRVYTVRHKDEWREAIAFGIGCLWLEIKDEELVKRTIEEGILGRARGGDDKYRSSFAEDWLCRDRIEAIRLRGYVPFAFGDEEATVREFLDLSASGTFQIDYMDDGLRDPILDMDHWHARRNAAGFYRAIQLASRNPHFLDALLRRVRRQFEEGVAPHWYYYVLAVAVEHIPEPIARTLAAQNNRTYESWGDWSQGAARKAFMEAVLRRFPAPDAYKGDRSKNSDLFRLKTHPSSISIASTPLSIGEGPADSDAQNADEIASRILGKTSITKRDWVVLRGLASRLSPKLLETLALAAITRIFDSAEDAADQAEIPELFWILAGVPEEAEKIATLATSLLKVVLEVSRGLPLQTLQAILNEFKGRKGVPEETWETANDLLPRLEAQLRPALLLHVLGRTQHSWRDFASWEILELDGLSISQEALSQATSLLLERRAHDADDAHAQDQLWDDFGQALVLFSAEWKESGYQRTPTRLQSERRLGRSLCRFLCEGQSFIPENVFVEFVRLYLRQAPSSMGWPRRRGKWKNWEKTFAELAVDQLTVDSLRQMVLVAFDELRLNPVGLYPGVVVFIRGAAERLSAKDKESLAWEIISAADKADDVGHLETLFYIELCFMSLAPSEVEKAVRLASVVVDNPESDGYQIAWNLLTSVVRHSELRNFYFFVQAAMREGSWGFLMAAAFRMDSEALEEVCQLAERKLPRADDLFIPDFWLYLTRLSRQLPASGRSGDLRLLLESRSDRPIFDPWSSEQLRERGEQLLHEMNSDPQTRVTDWDQWTRLRNIAHELTARRATDFSNSAFSGYEEGL